MIIVISYKRLNLEGTLFLLRGNSGRYRRTFSLFSTEENDVDCIREKKKGSEFNNPGTTKSACSAFFVAVT